MPEPLRGKYLAFCPERIREAGGGGAGADGLSAGLSHLAALRAAGLNHLHLLPTYDFATVPEREEEQKKLDWVRGALGVGCGVGVG